MFVRSTDFLRFTATRVGRLLLFSSSSSSLSPLLIARAIREASTLYSFGHDGVYDHEQDRTFYYGPMVDLGDVDIIHTDTQRSHLNTKLAVQDILRQGGVPVVLGGDHSITAPVVEAFGESFSDGGGNQRGEGDERQCGGGGGGIHVVQFDAHLDFVDERHGVRYGHGNCMKRCSEMPHVSGLTQLGIRGVSSTAKEGYEDARASGSSIYSVRQLRALAAAEEGGGAAAVAALVPRGNPLYVTIDIDGFDPAIAPGTGTPSHGGFHYYEVTEVLQALSETHRIVGFDICEVAPPYDHAEVTSTLAARVALDLVGYINAAREKAGEGGGGEMS